MPNINLPRQVRKKLPKSCIEVSAAPPPQIQGLQGRAWQ